MATFYSEVEHKRFDIAFDNNEFSILRYLGVSNTVI